MGCKIQAVNNYVFVKRDATESENNGLILPSGSKIKPHTGVILSIGNLVRDVKIKGSKDKKALFHKDVGQEMEYDGETFLILEDIHILAIV